MNLEEIKYHVDLRNQKINLPFIEESGFEFCREFTEKNKCTNIYDFASINIYDAITCLYYIKSKNDITISDAKSFIETFSDYFKMLDYERLHAIWYTMADIYSKYQLEPILEYLDEKNQLKAKKILNSFNFVDPKKNISTEEMIKINQEQRGILSNLKVLQRRFDVARIFREMDKNGELIGQIIDMICVHKHVNITKEIYHRSHKSSDPTEIINKKELKDFIKSHYNTKRIISIIASISSYVTKQNFEKSNHISSIKKEIRNNEQAYKLLCELSKKEEITDARKIVKKIKDEELKHIFLKFIYEHNNKYYVRLEEELNNLKKNTKSAYLEELNKYGIIIDTNEITKLMYNNLEDFKELLSILTNLSLEKTQIIKILKYTNLEKTKKVKNYINEGYLNIKYIKNNIEIFYINEKQLSIVEQNIDMLSFHDLNPKMFIDYPEILLSDNNTVIDNIILLNKYSFKEYLKNTVNYEFLLRDDLEDKLDKYIELGYSAFLEQDLSILNSSNIKRLELLKVMNIPISTVEELKQHLTTDKFIINDKDLDDYIPNVFDYKERPNISLDLNDLEEYRIDKRMYSINGVLISSNKVKKLLEMGYNLYDALIYNLCISEDEYNLLLKKIKKYTI